MKKLVVLTFLFCFLSVTAKTTNIEAMITDVKIESGTVADVVTLAMAKKQLKLEADFTEEDELIQVYIDASIELSEKFIGGHIHEKTITFSLNKFDNPLSFEAFPVKSIVEVKYFNEANEETLMDAEKYKLTTSIPKVYDLRFIGDLPNVYDRFDAVTVKVSVGMDVIPKPIKQACLLMISDMYERREDRVEVLSTASMSLLRPYKKY